MAGSVSGGPRKSIRGTRQCLEDLQTIFEPSRIWPNLASWDQNDSNHLYLYDPWVLRLHHHLVYSVN